MQNALLDASCYLDLALYETGREVCIANKEVQYTPKTYPLLHYVYVGGGSFHYRNHVYELKAGDCFLIPANETAIYRCGSDHPWSYLWIGIGGAKVEGLLHLCGLDADHPVIHDASFRLKPYLDKIYDCYFENGYFNLDALSQLYSLFAELESKKQTKVENLEKGHISAAKAYIRNNFQFPITIVDVARSVGVSPNYLANLFQKECGQSPKSFLIQTRMETAKSLLTTSDASINEVSRAVGYQSPLHFSGSFRRYHGVSPLHYRNKGGKSK